MGIDPIKTFRRLLLCGIACAIASPALADEAAGDDGTIIVTAQKRVERLQDVPMPISVVSAASLTEQNDTQLRDYFTSLPGLSISSAGNGRSTIAVRGITTGSGNSPTVGIVLDDVPLGASTGSGLGDAVLPEIDPSSIQQVEVLRGPQGTLYGASSLGGLIKYVTVAPDLNRLGGSASVSGDAVQGGSAGYAVRGAINIPLIKDELALRVSGFVRHDPGYIDDAGTGQKNVNTANAAGGKAQLLWKVSPKVEILASADIQSTRSDGTSDMDVTINHTPVYGDYEHKRLPGTGLGDKQIQIYSLKGTADLDFATLTSITSFSHITFAGPQDVSGTFGRYLTYFFDDTSGMGVGIDNNYLTRKWTQELRLASKSHGALEWLVGGYFTHEANNNFQNIYVGDTQSTARVDFPSLYTLADITTYREFAGYADATYHFTDKLSLQGGIRYAANHQSYYQNLGGVLEGDTEITASTSNDHAVTWLVSPSYHLTRDLMLYARVATGYRPGGPNLVPSSTSAPATFGPDRTTNYDVGLKGQVIDKILSIDLALFDIEWKNIQLLETDASTGFSFTGNGGTARSRGVEASATLTPRQGLTATGSFTYTDAQLRQDVDVSSLYGKVGDSLPYSAKYAASLDVEQRFAVSQQASAYLGANMAYTGDRKADFARSATQQRFDMPGFVSFGLRAGMEANGWDYSVYVRNLTNKLAFIQGSALDTITRAGTFGAGVIQPRTFGISIGKKF